MFDFDVPEAPPLVAENLGADVSGEVGLSSRGLVPDRFVHENDAVLGPVGGICSHRLLLGTHGLRSRDDLDGGVLGSEGEGWRRHQNESECASDEKTQGAGHVPFPP